MSSRLDTSQPTSSMIELTVSRTNGSPSAARSFIEIALFLRRSGDTPRKARHIGKNLPLSLSDGMGVLISPFLRAFPSHVGAPAFASFKGFAGAPETPAMLRTFALPTAGLCQETLLRKDNGSAGNFSRGPGMRVTSLLLMEPFHQVAEDLQPVLGIMRRERGALGVRHQPEDQPCVVHDAGYSPVCAVGIFRVTRGGATLFVTKFLYEATANDCRGVRREDVILASGHQRLLLLTD